MSDRVMTRKQFWEALAYYADRDMVKTFDRWGTPVFNYVNLCSYGDYDNSCQVERANVRELVEYRWDGRFDRCRWDSVWHGSYGTVAWGFDPLELPKRSKFYAVFLEMLDALADYPLLNDEMLSLCESEAEDEAMADWVLHDLRRELRKVGRDALADQEDDDLARWLYQEMDRQNEYFLHESGGNVWLAVEKIVQRADREIK